MDVQELVQTIVREVLKQLRGGPEKPCVMVLDARDEALAAKVEECLGEDVEVLYFGKDAGGRTPARYVLPFLSCGGMAELAGGRAVGPVLSETLRLLLAGIEVDVLEFEYKAYRETAPGPLYGLYETYEATLASFGLKEFRRRQPGTLRLGVDLVTERTVLQAREQGASVLRVPMTAKVTPLAAETARELNINILKRS